MNPLFEKLKEDGLTVHIDHLRRVNNSNSYVSLYVLRNGMKSALNPRSILARGGKTVAKIMRGDQLLGHGVSFCHPMDNYVRKTGAERALRRAYLEMKENDAIQRTIDANERLINEYREAQSPALV